MPTTYYEIAYSPGISINSNLKIGSNIAFNLDGTFNIDNNPGISGQILSSNGANTIPHWINRLDFLQLNDTTTSNSIIQAATANAVSTTYTLANSAYTIANTNPLSAYVLSANSVATATTISPYFGANTAIPLSANTAYEIEMECWFLKNTAGTLIWTLTNSANVNSLSATIETSPITGVSATLGAAQLNAQVTAQTNTSVSFAATGTLTTGANHFARFKVILINSSSTSFRLNVTNSAGTITPLAGSRWKSKIITNVGSYTT